ncbi:HET-domain-containing protein, partial [Aspergillus sclerotioniger CBS 115572]
MRLINTSTYEMNEFEGRDIPEYAILSHTWGEGEVTFTDYDNLEYARTRPAFHKVEHSCRLANEHRLNWVWIDTCCIDKRSSAELSEAINSMFAWYRKSAVCFAYLSDVPAHVTAENDSGNTFERSRWFTRGWTLQELLAPENVVFYGTAWTEYGTRQQLRGRISAITNINEVALESRSTFKLYSVASRMSWAAQRQTKRVEDRAYCLLGIFEVNMPLLYGEGERAFIRLQEEILRETDDQSIFAWECEESGRRSFLSGLLAASPAYFAGSNHLMRGWRVRNDIPPTVTSRGVRIKCPL